MKSLGYGEGYKYAHDEAEGVAAMECLPDRLKGRTYFKPTTRGREKEIGERLLPRRRFERGKGVETGMTWLQTYAPLGDVFISALVAALPVVVLLGLLAFFHVRAHLAALAGLAAAWLVAVFVFGMPVSLATAAAGYGALYGLFPIGWIVLNAIFIYDVTVKTGQFDIVKRTIAGLGDDRRIQALLIAFSFGAFIEGAAGFGTPVAISGAMLIGLGFRPLEAAGLALIGNTAPVAFGALGTPMIALNAVTHLPLDKLSAMVGRQLPFFSVIVPFWLIVVHGRLEGHARGLARLSHRGGELRRSRSSW